MLLFPTLDHPLQRYQTEDLTQTFIIQSKMGPKVATPKKVTKASNSAGKSPSKSDSDKNLLFLWMCLKSLDVQVSLQ